MAPESITVDLETAKKLKEAGWPQDLSVFWHAEHWLSKSYLGLEQETHPRTDTHCVEYFSAPTIGEIINRLPCERRYLPKDLIHDPNEWARLWIIHNSK